MKNTVTEIVCVVLTLVVPHAAAEESLDFSRDVQPILADHCYACHGPDADTREAELRLDVRKSAVGETGDGRVIVAGIPEDSELVRRIFHSDPDVQMPPARFKRPLTDAERKTLVAWIDQGAQYGKHWAFEPIRQPEFPQIDSNNQWLRTDLDRFVLAALQAKAIAPAPETGRVSWMRRVTQDLAGLPPTVEQVDAFLNDDSEDAAEKVVSRLLNSVDYAERMTAIWLDHSRYADSNGYQFDNTRKMWPWRDWVIQAFKENMPFDQFVTEQLAGDLIPGATQDQKIATGFNRNHGFTIEGGVSAEEYRTMYANDKTTTAGTLFLGLTLECCRCHDHKYDPISTKEYYSLFAFFNSSAEGGVGALRKPNAPFIAVGDGNVMIMQEQSRATHVLTGGQFDQLGEAVIPSTPSVLPAFGDRPRNRLGLARWLVDPQNPLFARVTVNRMWQQFFGIGLVKTVDNFGVQGEIPPRRELLDFLAADFRDNGWDMHRLIRTIVLSATYRQSSRHRPKLEDPENRLLARGPSFRLPAEMIRDQALAVSGLLVSTVGGPSVKPYQPAGIWEDLNAPKSHAEIYTQDSGQSLYRKSMYTFWRRAAMHPGMAVFDAPSRDVCSVQRSATNTPLQALALMHDPIYIEAARKLAELVIRRESPRVRTADDFIDPKYVGGVTVKEASSQYSPTFSAGFVVDGSGIRDGQHAAISDNNSWLNAKTEGPTSQITFDLREHVDLSSIHVWNYNETRRGLSTRGVRDVEVFIDNRADGKSFRSLGMMTFEKATGNGDYRGRSYDLAKDRGVIRNVRLVRFEIQNNHGGDLVGLSEVAFIKAQEQWKPDIASETKVPIVSNEEAIAAAMRHTLSRHATQEELTLLGGLFRQRLSRYRTDMAAAKALLKVGESRTDPKLDVTRIAAMADVCLAIFNLSETITRK